MVLNTGSKNLDQPGRTRLWLGGYPRAVPVLIFLAILAITGLSVLAIELGENERERALMREVSRSVASALEKQGSTSSSYLRSGAALFSSADEVESPLFRRFVSELRLDSEYRGADGIGWAEVIKPGEISGFEDRIAVSSYGSFRVQPAPSADVQRVVPVTFLQPDTERNRRAIGYDMYSEPTRRQAMEEAARLVRPTATGKVVLVQEGGENAPGFLIYMPVFESTDEGRSLKGFIYSPFNTQTFLNSAIELENHQAMGVRLYDGERSPDNLVAELAPMEATGTVITDQVRIANRPMLLEIESTRGSALAPLSMATMLFGLSLASLLMLLARMVTRQAVEDQNTLAHLEEQNSIRNSLTRELNHRVKNTLANVLSIIALTRRRSEDLEEFADGLEGRVRALSATHDLLTQSDWGTVSIRDVIEAEVSPYSQGQDGAVEYSGPDVLLAPNDALSLGMAIHELATNAAKFGALGNVGGKVKIDWRMEGEKLAFVEWCETGGPPVPELREPGFGTELIEKIVAHELKNPVELSFDPDGVRCTLRVPVRSRGEFQLRESELI